MSSPFWVNNPTILLKHDKLSEFWPEAQMTVEEKVNAITRLVILLTLLGYLVTFSLKILLAGIVTLAIIVGLYFLQNRMSNNTESFKEFFSNKLPGVYPSYTNPDAYEQHKDNFIKPTPKNPLMNVLLPEIKYDPTRKAAAPSFNPSVEKEINDSVKEFVEKPFNDKNISKKLFNNIGDELVFNRSMLQYNSVPNTVIPSDQKAYLEFLYGTMPSGKDGNIFALEKIAGGAYDYINP